MALGGINSKQLKGRFFQTDVLISSSIVMILLIMIIPFPTQLMDFFLAINISLSLVVLLVAFYALKPFTVCGISGHVAHINIIPAFAKRWNHPIDFK